jgi:hypothetical protein
VIVDNTGQPLLDPRGAVREFSTEKRASAFMRLVDKVILGNR